jgi:hypothetical protein
MQGFTKLPLLGPSFYNVIESQPIEEALLRRPNSGRKDDQTAKSLLDLRS